MIEVRIFPDGTVLSGDDIRDIEDDINAQPDDYAGYKYDDTKPVHIEHLSIEVTRNCNLSCRHCLRGASSDSDLTFKVISSLAAGIQYVDILTLTGGEPGLASGAIDNVIDTLRTAHDFGIGAFYLSTNGIPYQRSLAHRCLELQDMCQNPDESLVNISYGKWHGTDKMDTPVRWLAFAEYREDRDNILYTGNAKELGDDHYKYIPERVEVCEYADRYVLSGGILYMTVDGDILVGCDYSYDEMDEHVLISVSDPDFPYTLIARIAHGNATGDCNWENVL